MSLGVSPPRSDSPPSSRSTVYRTRRRHRPDPTSRIGIAACALAASSLVFGPALGAQTSQPEAPSMRCVIKDTTPPNAAPTDADGECVIGLAKPAKASDPQRAVVRVVVSGLPAFRAGGPSQLPVVASFRTDPHEGAGAGTLSADTVTVSPTGDAHAVWFRSAGGSTVAGVSVTVRTGGGTAIRHFRLVPGEPPAEPKYVLENPNGDEYDGHPRWGYEKTRLRHRLLVEVRRVDGKTTVAVPDTAACTARRILFRRIGTTGTILPDTAIPVPIRVVRPPHDTAYVCQADVQWVLGDGPGTFEARAALVGRDSAALPIEYRAHARSLPKFIAALGGTRERHYFALNPATEGYKRRFEMPLPGGGTESFDSTLAGGKPDTISVEGRVHSNAILGLSFAPVSNRYFRGISGMIGVDPSKPADNWYVGLSLLRLLAYGGIESEHVPLDAYATVNVGRVTQLKDPNTCASTRSADACSTKDPRELRGWGLAISLDATSLITDAIKKVAGF